MTRIDDSARHLVARQIFGRAGLRLHRRHLGEKGGGRGSWIYIYIYITSGLTMGSPPVDRWSNGGQTVVKRWWSNGGQMVVVKRWWSNGGRTVVVKR